MELKWVGNKSVIKCVAFMLISLYSFPILSADILIVSSSPSKVYTKVANYLINSFNSKCHKNAHSSCSGVKLKKIQQDKINSIDVIGSEYSLVITLGRNAAKTISSISPEIPTIFALIPEQTYINLTQKKLDFAHSAVFLDQPFSRQLNLSKIINPDARLGILLSDSNIHNQERYAEWAKQIGVDVHFRKIEKPSSIGFDLKKLMQDTSLLLALPDANIYNKRTIFNILLSSYHNQIPLIGFSAAYVKAGALAALHSSPKQIGTHLSELVYEVITHPNRAMPAPSFAKYYSVSINKGVANSLDISLPAESQIIEIIKEGEK